PAWAPSPTRSGPGAPPTRPRPWGPGLGAPVETAATGPQFVSHALHFSREPMNTATAATPIVAACPQCHALVRVPTDRSNDHPVCPRCKSELFKGEPVALDAASFSTYVERTSLPV